MSSAMAASVGTITTSEGQSTILSQRQTEYVEKYGSTLLDLDNADTLPALLQQVARTSTQNFLVTFDDEHAHTIVDAPMACLQEMLVTQQSPSKTTRWLNIFKPYQHKDLLEALAQQYDFAPRLLAEMCSPPQPHKIVPNSLHTNSSKTSSRRFWSSKSQTQASAKEHSQSSFDRLSELSSSSAGTTIDQKSIYRLASEIWHYTTIDFGRNYICCGYNALFGIAPITDYDVDGAYHLPSCTRVWNWLVICDDGTVITVTEDILPVISPRYNDIESRLIHETRRNIINVFRALSLVDNDPLETSNRMILLPIRTRLGSSPEETLHRQSDTPGLLFFYLFQNWQNSYTLITRKESRYGLELELLRKEMLVQPRLGHIDRLHRIGQELGVLKRHYNGYNCLIDRLLEPRPPTAVSLQNSAVLSHTGDDNTSQPLPAALAKESSVGVSLSTAARVRFKRLHDQIQLYALEEVDEYLAQKDSLISLNFNLLTLRESLDVERLTRITLLLTKATILFLPISFMTSYFSLKLLDTDYSITQFWIAFAIILSLSWMALYAFGVLSGTAQTAAVFGAIGKGLRNMSDRFASRHRGKSVGSEA